jgi:hypothetical protein
MRGPSIRGILQPCTTASLKARIPLILGKTAPYIGFMTAEAWDETQRWMLRHRLIERSTPVAPMFTVDLLPRTPITR